MGRGKQLDMATEESISVRSHDGAEIIIRRYANPGRDRIILSHGNGFAIDGYRAFWSLLQPDFELVLFDQRSHGRNPRVPIEQHSIEAMAGDHLTVQKAVLEHYGPRFTVGLFHSVSSIASIKASMLYQARWDGLVLFDPPMIAPEGNSLREKGKKIDDILANFARNRKHSFDDLKELQKHYRTTIGPVWVEDADMDMARAVTRPGPDGGYVLSCPGEYEAKIYLENAQFNSFEGLAALNQPTLIIGADPEFGRPMPPALVGPQAAAAHNIPHIIVPDTSHLLQLEKPKEIAAHVRDFFARLRT